MCPHTCDYDFCFLHEHLRICIYSYTIPDANYSDFWTNGPACERWNCSRYKSACHRCCRLCNNHFQWYVLSLCNSRFSNLSLVKDNWLKWKQKMMQVLGLSDLDDYILGSISVPDLITDPTSSRKWARNNSKTISVLQMHVDDSELQFLENITFPGRNLLTDKRNRVLSLRSVSFKKCSPSHTRMMYPHGWQPLIVFMTSVTTYMCKLFPPKTSCSWSPC